MLGNVGGPSLASAMSNWAAEHSSVWPEDTWPKFYRPLLKLTFVLDVHGFGCSPRLSTLLSLVLHSGCCLLVASIVNHFDPIHRRGLAAAFLSALPSAALEAPLWISARGSLIVALVTLAGVRIALSGLAMRASGSFALAALALIGMASHESAVVAIPLWGTVLVTRCGWKRVTLTTLIGPGIACVAFLALRSHIVGTWVGGYRGSDEMASVMGAFISSACGVAAVAIPGHGPLPFGLGCTIAVTVCFVLGMLALQRIRYRALSGGGYYSWCCSDGPAARIVHR